MKGKTDYDCPICRRDSVKLGMPPIPAFPDYDEPPVRRNRMKQIIAGVIVLIVFGVSLDMILHMHYNG